MTAAEPLKELTKADEQPAQPPMTLSRCAGWRDLLAQPAIDASGIPVRIGLSHEAIATGGIALVYVAVDQGWRVANPVSDDQCGPVRILVTPPQQDDTGPQLDGVRLAEVVKPNDPGVELHVRAVICDRPGVWRIEVESHIGQSLATAAITVAGDAGAPWCAMAGVDGQAMLQAAVQIDEAEEATLNAILHPGPGLPGAPGNDTQQPWMLLARDRATALLVNRDGPDLPLPNAEAAETSIAATYDRGWLDLRLPAGLSDGYEDVADHLLLRWWRNGAPWSPPAEPALQQAMDMIHRMIQEAQPKPVRVRLPIDWGTLPSGDTLAVQMLWSRPGIVHPIHAIHCGPEEPYDVNTIPLALSNVVTFTVP